MSKKYRFAIILLLLWIPPQARAQARFDWAEGFEIAGMTGGVFAAAGFDDGNGPALYAGGNFTTAGGTIARRLAKWDGTRWSALSREIGDGKSTIVRALKVFDDGTGTALYAGGYIFDAGEASLFYIGKWDGKRWSPLGRGVSGEVFALAVFDDGSGPALYAGGNFIMAGGVFVNHIAKWDGTNWWPLDTGVEGAGLPPVSALAVFDDGRGPALYAGGRFTAAGGVSANHIARWDGTHWSPLGSGVGNFEVRALAVFDDGHGPALYAGGQFTTAGDVSANHVAKWDGKRWSPLGSGMRGTFPNPFVAALTVFDDGAGPALYAGGVFTTAGGVSANHIAKWDGTRWSALGRGMGNAVLALTVSNAGGGEGLYAGGGFDTAGEAIANHIAQWDGTDWSALGSGNGMSQPVGAWTTSDDSSGPVLYAGGSFITAGGALVNRIAKWDGTNWSALGRGIDGYVRALTVFDDGTGPALYAGGSFITAGGALVNHIAKWDGMRWSALDSGVSDVFPSVRALAVFDDGTGPALYVGGMFTLAGDVRTSNIAKWDGTRWSALDRGVGAGYSNVDTLTVFDDGTGPALYVGGNFSGAGEVRAYNIAKWDGTRWSALDGGIAGGVSALTVFDDGRGPALYAGGLFIMAGDVRANHIAKWDGKQWSALGDGVDLDVSALTVFDDGTGPALYTGGRFTNAGGVRAKRIAKWNGTGWSALGSGLSGIEPSVLVLTAFDDGRGPALYAGGVFTKAGDRVSTYVGKWAAVDEVQTMRPEGR